jgi:8-oxo-dGTP pyrophosphatase MutT (NUDIX family)
VAWIVKQSRYVLRDRWVTLRADDCVTPSGVEVAPFYVLEYPDWVHVVALDADEHLILVRQYRHGYRGDSLELPGGVMDAADQDPIATARRELAEETGYTCDTCRLIGSLSPNPGTHTNRAHVVLAQSARYTRPPTPEADEDLTVVRMPVEEAIQAALTGDMVHVQHVGLLMIGLKAAGLFP